MNSRTGKHFKNEKDRIIHDKTGRVRVACILLKQRYLCQLMGTTVAELTRTRTVVSYYISTFVSADCHFVESLCKVA